MLLEGDKIFQIELSCMCFIGGHYISGWGQNISGSSLARVL